jgi:Mitochondrial carrier protein
MQLLSPSPAAVYSGMSHAVSRISSTEGLRTLWRGVASVIAGAGPAHAVQFGTLEAVKEMLGKQEGSLAWASTGLLYSLPEHTACPAVERPWPPQNRQCFLFLSLLISVLLICVFTNNRRCWSGCSNNQRCGDDPF